MRVILAPEADTAIMTIEANEPKDVSVLAAETEELALVQVELPSEEPAAPIEVAETSAAELTQATDVEQSLDEQATSQSVVEPVGETKVPECNVTCTHPEEPRQQSI